MVKRTGSQRVRAAKAAVDPERLIEGENPETKHPDDARHWVAIYYELLSFKEGVLARVYQEMATMSEAARTEVARTDQPVLEAELDRLRRRLEFWRRRHWELGGLDFDADRQRIAYQDRTVALTRRESELLAFLLAHPNRGFRSHELLRTAWHDPHLATDQVRGYVVRLRKKMASLDLPCRLESHPREGYSLVFDSPPP
jgi:DNA-binding response OmpR family regulator